MMKKILLVFFVMSYFTVCSQTGKISYRTESIKTDKLDNPRVKGISEELNLMTFSLAYNKTKSYFKKNKSLSKNKMFNVLASIVIKGKNTWYQDLVTKKAMINKEISGEIYQVNYETMKNWELTSETKKIEGYTCYKAIRKELNKRYSTGTKKVYIVFIAWYTPDIPASFGPLGNGGLPGLILQLERPNLVRLTASKISLNKKNIKIESPKKGDEINVDEMVRLMRKQRKVTVD